MLYRAVCIGGPYDGQSVASNEQVFTVDLIDEDIPNIPYTYAYTFHCFYNRGGDLVFWQGEDVDNAFRYLLALHKNDNPTIIVPGKNSNHEH